MGITLRYTACYIFLVVVCPNVSVGGKGCRSVTTGLYHHIIQNISSIRRFYVWEHIEFEVSRLKSSVCLPPAFIYLRKSSVLNIYTILNPFGKV